MSRPELRVINTETGEVIQDDSQVLIEQLESEKRAQSLQIGKLKKELRELRAVEPESQDIRDVLDYWRQQCKPRASIAIGGKRWEKARARLRERFDDRPPFTAGELCLAVDGALLDPWLNGTAHNSRGYLDAETIFRDAEMVEKLRDLALGFQAKTGVHLRDLIEVAEELPVVNWRHILRICGCGHRRLEHSRADPNREGQEGCFFCECDDFYPDPLMNEA